jgi:uncharacterized protein YqhQ
MQMLKNILLICMDMENSFDTKVNTKQQKRVTESCSIPGTSLYGGQALIEGVMFKSKSTISMAVRKPDGTIHVESEADTFKPNYFFRLPFIRGFVSLVRMSIIGTKYLHKSADIATDDESKTISDGQLTDSKTQTKVEQSKSWLMIATTLVIGALSIALALGLFKALPFFTSIFLTDYFNVAESTAVIFEGIIKFFILLLYIYLISFIPDIKRVFMYHGAEHKVIRAYEAGKELTIRNIAQASRFHPRCGTSFLVFVVGISIVVYSFIPLDIPLWLRFVMRLLLLPVVAGLSFEFIQFTAKVQNITWLSWLKLPGYGVQLLTTKEPTDDQIEVALASFEACRK